MTNMHNSRRIFPPVFLGSVQLLHAMCAFASGREGEAYVDAVLWIVIIVLVAFSTLVLGGALLGAHRAGQSGDSRLKGCALGLLKGMVAFLGVGAVSIVALTILGILWIAYSFLDVYVLSTP